MTDDEYGDLLKKTLEKLSAVLKKVHEDLPDENTVMTVYFTPQGHTMHMQALGDIPPLPDGNDPEFDALFMDIVTKH